METNQPQLEKKKIIDSFWTFIVATAFLGPLALPLLWRNPNYKVSTKIIGSLAVILFTLFLMYFVTGFLNTLLAQLTEQIPQ